MRQLRGVLSVHPQLLSVDSHLRVCIRVLQGGRSHEVSALHASSRRFVVTVGGCARKHCKSDRRSLVGSGFREDIFQSALLTAPTGLVLLGAALALATVAAASSKVLNALESQKAS